MKCHCGSNAYLDGLCRFHYAQERFDKGFSHKKSDITREIKRLKFEAINTQYGRCYFCGDKTGLDAVHIIRRSDSPKLADHKDNVIAGCRKCHTIFDDKSGEELLQLKNLNKVLEIMFRLDSYYFFRFIQKRRIESIQHQLTLQRDQS